MKRRVYLIFAHDVIPAAWLILLALVPVTFLLAIWWPSTAGIKLALSNLILFGAVYAIDRIIDGG